MKAPRTTAAALLAVGTLALAGCGSGNPTTSPSTVTASETASAPATDGGTHAPSTTTSASTTIGSTLCRAADLKLSNGRSDGTAGSSYTPLIFTNAGLHPCTLTGFPGVSFAASNTGDPIGAPADRDKPKPTITLGINEKASALLRITVAGNYGDKCRQVSAAGLRIYPPDNTDSFFLPWDTSACANTDVHLLEISSLVPGETGN